MHAAAALVLAASVRIGFDMPFDGLATPNNIALARLNLEAATKDLERIRDDIRVAVARAYVQVLYDYEIVDVARKQIELDDAQVERLEALAATGKAAQAEVSQQKASRAQSGVTLVQAENNLRLALLDLAQLLEFTSSDGFSVERPTVAVDEIVLDMPERILRSNVIALEKHELLRVANLSLNVLPKSSNTRYSSSNLLVISTNSLRICTILSLPTLRLPINAAKKRS